MCMLVSMMLSFIRFEAVIIYISSFFSRQCRMINTVIESFAFPWEIGELLADGERLSAMC